MLLTILRHLNVDANNEDIFNLNYINNGDHETVCTDDEEKDIETHRERKKVTAV
jgi:hypothetical protein